MNSFTPNQYTQARSKIQNAIFAEQGKHIHKVADAEVPDQAAHDSQLLFNEPDYLKIGDNRDAALINEDGLPSRAKDTFKQGVYY